MRLLVDTDAFCKLAAADLLAAGAEVLSVELDECGRLPALPHMLERGTLPRVYGSETCQRLIPIARSMPAVERPRGPWLDALTPITEIDPGEAILFSLAAEHTLPVVTGDVRALHALRQVEGFPEALAGRIVCLEALLLGLCERIGVGTVRTKVEPIRDTDTMMRVCFSPNSATPEDGLRSYLRDRRTDLAPLLLWPIDQDSE